MSKPAALTVAQMIFKKGEQDAERCKSARCTYVRLMHADTATEADVAALADAAGVLNLTHSQIAADHAAIVEAKSLLARLKSLAGAPSAHAKLSAFISASYAKCVADVRRIEEQHAKLVEAKDDAWLSVQAIANAEKSLSELKAKFPILADIASLPPERISTIDGEQPNPHYKRRYVKDVEPEETVPSFAELLADYVAVVPKPLTRSKALADELAVGRKPPVVGTATQTAVPTPAAEVKPLIVPTPKPAAADVPPPTPKPASPNTEKPATGAAHWTANNPTGTPPKPKT